MADSAQFKFDSKEWDRALSDLRGRWKNLEQRKTVTSIIAVHVFADIIDHFEEERGPSGPWQAWSKAYSDHMKKKGRGGNQILQNTGWLRQNVKPNNWRASNEGMLFYNNAKTKGTVTDDNSSDRDLDKMRRAEAKTRIQKSLKKKIGNKAARFVAKTASKKLYKVRKKKSQSSGKGLPYAMWHDEGKNGMPKRTFMWLSPKATDKILADIIKWLKEG
jgi:phage gpG-like protein